MVFAWNNNDDVAMWQNVWKCEKIAESLWNVFIRLHAHLEAFCGKIITNMENKNYATMVNGAPKIENIKKFYKFGQQNFRKFCFC